MHTRLPPWPLSPAVNGLSLQVRITLLQAPTSLRPSRHPACALMLSEAARHSEEFTRAPNRFQTSSLPGHAKQELELAAGFLHSWGFQFSATQECWKYCKCSEYRMRKLGMPRLSSEKLLMPIIHYSDGYNMEALSTPHV